MFEKLKHTIRNIFDRKAVILMYHQVSERSSDPWELAVSPEIFDEQISFLKQNFNIVPLAEIANDVIQKKIRSEKLAITFDDGFIDNYTNARPILEAHGVPATFYVATHATSTGKSFWWEILESLILHTERLPRFFKMKIGDDVVDFIFYTDDVLTRRLRNEIKEWTADKTIPNERIELYYELWRRIQPLPFREQYGVLDAIREWTKSDVKSLQPQIMSLNELDVLNKNKLFSIQAHTVHHAMLATQDLNTQAYEVRESKNAIERWLGTEVRGFAYPYGNYNSDTIKVLRESGFQYAVSTESRAVRTSDNVFALPRIHVKNWNAQELSTQIQNALTHETH